MNCEQFRQRLNDVLDQRLDVADDESLSSHAGSCVDCRAHLETWSTIDQIVFRDPDSDVTHGHRHVSDAHHQSECEPSATRRPVYRFAVAMGLAASVLICAQAWLNVRPNTSRDIVAVTQPDSLSSSQDLDPVDHQTVETPDPLPLSLQTDHWWSTVSDERWVYQTIPTVDSVRAGVAPIGRSMRRALAILMIRSEPTTMDRSDVAPDAPPAQHQEQTSSTSTRRVRPDQQLA